MSAGAERELPKGVNENIKRHNWLYISGLLLVLVMVGYLAVTYAKDAKETKKSQDLVQQQINLQKEQLQLQAKQLEDANKKNSVANTPPVTTKPTVKSTPKQYTQEDFDRVRAVQIKTPDPKDMQSITDKFKDDLDDQRLNSCLNGFCY